VTDLSPQANRERTLFARIAVAEVAFALLMLVVGVTNAATGFVGHVFAMFIAFDLLGFAVKLFARRRGALHEE
jgi:hypothetical protein